MKTLVEAGRSLRNVSFKFTEIYAITAIFAIIVGSWLGVDAKWLTLSAFLLFSPVLYICGRCIWQYCFGPKYSAALVRSMAQRYAVDQRGSHRATLIKAFQKDAEAFTAERLGMEGKLNALGRRISEGDFDWPDISWWKAYHELAKLMDEVLSK